MTPSPLEIAERGIALWNEDRFEDARTLWHHDAVLVHPAGWPEPGPSVGRDAAFEQFARLRADFEVDRVEIVEVIRETADRVVLWLCWHARGHASGIETQVEMGVVYHVRDGLIDRGEFHWRRADLLAAGEE